MGPVLDNFRSIVARLEVARKRAIASAPSTVLIAVSKFHCVDEIRPLLVAGHRDFGENRVQEAQAKWIELKREFPDIRLHMIGPLQTNKVKEAVELFDAIHALDRPKLLSALKWTCEKAGRKPDLYVQVNTGEEPQKAGIAPAKTAAFVAEAKAAFGAQVKGLMCIPPFDEAPAPHFALLKTLAREVELPGLSMGMSDDFETAIAFGATYVRVGTSIFGPRQAPTICAAIAPQPE
jgi:PLP dependent protein